MNLIRVYMLVLSFGLLYHTGVFSGEMMEDPVLHSGEFLVGVLLLFGVMRLRSNNKQSHLARTLTVLLAGVLGGVSVGMWEIVQYSYGIEAAVIGGAIFGLVGAALSTILIRDRTPISYTTSGDKT